MDEKMAEFSRGFGGGKVPFFRDFPKVLFFRHFPKVSLFPDFPKVPDFRDFPKVSFFRDFQIPEKFKSPPHNFHPCQ